VLTLPDRPVWKVQLAGAAMSSRVCTTCSKRASRRKISTCRFLRSKMWQDAQ